MNWSCWRKDASCRRPPAALWRDSFLCCVLVKVELIRIGDLLVGMQRTKKTKGQWMVGGCVSSFGETGKLESEKWLLLSWSVAQTPTFLCSWQEPRNTTPPKLNYLTASEKRRHTSPRPFKSPHAPLQPSFLDRNRRSSHSAHLPTILHTTSGGHSRSCRVSCVDKDLRSQSS